MKLTPSLLDGREDSLEDREDSHNLNNIVFDDNNEVDFHLSQLSGMSQMSEKVEADSTGIDLDWDLELLKMVNDMNNNNGLPVTPEDMYDGQQPLLMPCNESISEVEQFQYGDFTPIFDLPDNFGEENQSSEAFNPEVFIIAPEAASPVDDSYDEANNDLLSPDTSYETSDAVLPKMCVEASEIGDDANTSSGYDALSDAATPWSYTPGTNNSISDNDLQTLSTKELNRRMSNLPKDEAQMLKQRRRTLKNRGYAQTCRHRRLDQHQGLQETNDELTSRVKTLENQLRVVASQRDSYKRERDAYMRERDAYKRDLEALGLVQTSEVNY